jgi:hypothetical protein
MISKFLSLFLILFLSTSVAKEKLFEKFPFREGVIESKVSGTVSGVVTTYFSDYGEKRLIIRDIKGINIDTKIPSITLIKEGYRYDFDLTKGVVYKTESIEEILKRSERLPLTTLEIYLNGKLKSLKCFSVEIDGKEVKISKKGAFKLHSSLKIFGFHEKVSAISIKRKRLHERYFKIPTMLKVIDMRDKGLKIYPNL